jgi:hypothetical protein
MPINLSNILRVFAFMGVSMSSKQFVGLYLPYRLSHASA